MSVTSPEDTVRAGSEVSLLLEVANTSDHDYVFDPSLNKLDIQVRDNQGNLAHLTHNGQEIRKHYGQNGGSAIHMRPGDGTHLAEISVDNLYDMTRPGKYTIQVSRVDEESKDIVKSNIITLKVVP